MQTTHEGGNTPMPLPGCKDDECDTDIFYLGAAVCQALS